ncbi:MAG: D-alanyl-D-alanine carboxypeptidase/D-alanyl-D-alanine-endopeptidase [Bdellovibrionales bacterium]|nr:D-alanyl-D-alanine carboxypeptidase/D-alanyl-D-alanine-endopeptidase [Bdellovibrionales bacterium]MCB0418998.1 D-alanyl-D-alanine carboxypeptidase/D-alanyl-D-alanine-endopeptidase [Bdellovibrionales bacterium]
MLKTLIFLILMGGPVASLAAPVTVTAPPDPARKRLAKEILDALQLEKNRALKAGIVIQSLNTGEILFSHDAEERLIPASVNKILTAYTALKILSPASTFKTEIYAVQPVIDGVLSGDLYIKGGGDPSLVSERMWMLVNELLRSGIKRINGDIIGDSTFFDKERTPESRPDYLKDQAYNAPIGALSFNFNTTTIYVQPGSRANVPPTVYADPENDYIDIVNQAKTTSKGSRYTMAVSRIKHVKGDLGDTVLLRGKIPMDHKEVRYYRNIANPTLYACHMFQQFLSRRGVTVVGNIREGAVPRTARQLLAFESLPMWHLIWGMNKFSNNFVADQIMKKVGAEVFGPPGSLAKGLQAMERELTKIGVPAGTYKIADGSGLTRQSHISAQQLMSVLVAASKDFSLAPEFIASLGIAGQDGTIRRRFLNSNAENILRAKTGSLDGVASLAGYTPSADGEMLAFVVLLNDPKGKYGRMTSWVDQVALAARRFTRK